MAKKINQWSIVSSTMFNIGSGELIVVAFIALLVIKPKNIPQVASSLARTLSQLQKGFQDVKKSFDESLKDTPINSLKEFSLDNLDKNLDNKLDNPDGKKNNHNQS